MSGAFGMFSSECLCHREAIPLEIWHRKLNSAGPTERMLPQTETLISQTTYASKNHGQTG
jgi:hypothetical protein